MSTQFDFLIDTYRTERIKTLSVWSQVPEERMDFRPEARARTPHEHMVHQCVSEDTWMKNMLGIEVAAPALPPAETRLDFLTHYAAVSAARLAQLEQKSDAWFQADTRFFEATRSRAWVLTRRLTHSAHHRGQLTVYLRVWGQELYSTYGPTADTGGLFQNGAAVVYRYDTIEELLAAEREGGRRPPLPGRGGKAVTERG
jgi:uncharacterized damage-inducible protein DinB